jgi:hypothetical protein
MVIVNKNISILYIIINFIKKIRYSFHLLFAIFDKPARALLLNMMSSNGKYGCVKCQQKGETVQFGNGHHLIYRFDPKMIDKPLRTKENYANDLQNKANGVKGDCIFGDLEYFNPVLSTNIDVMHSVFLGKK